MIKITSIAYVICHLIMYYDIPYSVPRETLSRLIPCILGRNFCSRVMQFSVFPHKFHRRCSLNINQGCDNIPTGAFHIEWKCLRTTFMHCNVAYCLAQQFKTGSPFICQGCDCSQEGLFYLLHACWIWLDDFRIINWYIKPATILYWSCVSAASFSDAWL